MTFWISWILLALMSAGIALQDFKTRLISVWLILLFSLVNLAHYVYLNSISALAENVAFCFSYFLLSFFSIQLYYFIKTKKWQKIIDEKIGWADIILFLSIGFTLESPTLVFFFTLCFMISLVIQIVFLRSNKHVPLAGILVVYYLVYLALKKLNYFNDYVMTFEQFRF